MKLIYALIISIIILFVVKKAFFNHNVEICLFHATWCGHCRDYLAAGTFDSTWNSIKANPDFKGVVFTKYNADNHKALVEKYKIQAFPTIIAVNSSGNKISEFLGDRNKPEDLLAFAKEALKISTTLA